MSDTNILLQNIKEHVNMQISIMREDKPNLAFFWERYMELYTEKINKVLKQIDLINNNEFIESDLSQEQIIMLYLITDLN